MRRHAWLCVLPLLCVIPLPVHAQDDDIIQILDEDEPLPGASSGEDLIIIEDDGDGLAAASATSQHMPALAMRGILPLAAEYIAVSGLVVGRGAAQLTLSSAGDPWRGLAEGRFGVDLKPRNPWRAHVDAWLRGQGRAALPARDALDGVTPRFDDQTFGSAARAELGEAYLGLRVPKGSLTVGRQVFAWSRSELARLGDVFNPPDQRAGLLFPAADDGRLPVMAVSGRVIIDRIALSAALAPWLELPRVPFFASDVAALLPTQGGLALAPAPELLGLPQLGRVYMDQREAVIGPRRDLSTAELALRVTGSAGGVDLGAQIFVGYDRMPVLLLDPGMARALGVANDGVINQGLRTALGELCAQPNRAGGCLGLGSLLALEYQRTVVGQIDGATTVGPAVLKIELAAAPQGDPLPGSVVHVIDERTRALSSTRLTRLALAVALESGYGEWVQGGLELVDTAYLNVPPQVRVARVEPVDTSVDYERTVHRLALGLAVHGALFDRDLLWRLSALASPLQRDFAVAPRVSYSWLLGQQLALGAELLGGPPGSLGGFSHRASRLYAEWRLEF
ncbi:MAG: hypothetical protein ABIJ09_18970 [Pseudomonadota bacterium]